MVRSLKRCGALTDTTSVATDRSLRSRAFPYAFVSFFLRRGVSLTEGTTEIKYNPEGDLIFSASKDHIINVWFSHNGERLGTYQGHNGTVWTIDVDCQSRQKIIPFPLLPCSFPCSHTD